MQSGNAPVQQTVAHFCVHGWMRVTKAFDSDAAKQMREVVWQALGDCGIHRDQPATWTVERPAQLRRLRKEAVFQAVGSKTVFETIDAILAGRTYDQPKDWGAFFITFPSGATWSLPAGTATQTTTARFGQQAA
jgi:hypothetical protein